MAHSKIDNTFNGAQDQLTALSSVFREDGKLAAECSDDCDLSQVRSAFESLISAMREAHTEATMYVENYQDRYNAVASTANAIKVGKSNATMPQDAVRKVSGDSSYTHANNPFYQNKADARKNDGLGKNAEIVKRMKPGADGKFVWGRDELGEEPDYNPAAGEYASNREYGMFTDQGNAEVAEIVDDIERNYEAGEFDSPEAAVDSAMNDLENLSNDNKSFEEADDTDVRNQVTQEILSRLRDTGFDESLNHMKKLAGLQQ